MRDRLTPRLSVSLAGAIVFALTAGHACAATTKTVGELQFDGAHLGMPLNDWKALSPPGETSHARAACAPAASALVCGYAAPDEEVTFPLVKSYRVRRAHYYFTAGALSKIEWRTSIDAFNDVMAMLETKYGPATQTLRDTVDVGDNIQWPRVRKIWRLTSGTIELTDPASPASQLAVQFDAPEVRAP